MNLRLCLSLCLLALLAAGVARAQEPWNTLPPTPELPPAQRSGYVEHAGARLYYAVYGRGAPVVLLHGGLGNSNYWGGLVPALRDAHYRAIVIDTRGHGRSTRSSAAYSYRLLADDVLAVLDRLHERRVDLVGWSDGGIVGLDIAMRDPQRLHRLVVYGANSDPAGTFDDAEQKPVFAAYLTRASDEYRRLSPTPGEFAAFLAQVEQMWAAEPHYTDAELSRIRTPTLVFDGAHEEAVRPEHAAYLTRTIPGAKLAILPDASHFGMLQQPAEFNTRVLEFLAGR